MTESIYFCRKLNRSQSLMYQIMLILMEEHKKARLGKGYIGIYDGGDSLVFDKETWKKMRKKILKYISENYKENFSNMQDDYIVGLFPGVEPLCYLRKISLEDIDSNQEDDKITITKNRNSQKYIIKFEMTNRGYSYQYNGYKKTQEKLQRTANTFVLMTLIYYILSWVFSDSKELFTIIKNIYIFVKNATFKSTSILLRIICVLIIWETIKYTLKKLTKK